MPVFTLYYGSTRVAGLGRVVFSLHRFVSVMFTLVYRIESGSDVKKYIHCVLFNFRSME